MPDERVGPVEELHALRHASFDWRLSRGDVGVYAVLLKHADAEGKTWPGPSLIGKTATLAVSNVKSSLKRLESLRYIKTFRPGLRKANRFQILESPRIHSRAIHQSIEEARRNLGMRTGPVSKQSRSATRPASRSPTGYACRSQLGMRTGHELALELTSELSTSATPLLSAKDQRQQAETRESVREEYRLLLKTAPDKARRFAAEPVFRKHLLDLLPPGSLPKLEA